MATSAGRTTRIMLRAFADKKLNVGDCIDQTGHYCHPKQGMRQAFLHKLGWSTGELCSQRLTRHHRLCPFGANALPQ
jgi:hypothetical protein